MTLYLALTLGLVVGGLLLTALGIWLWAAEAEGLGLIVGIPAVLALGAGLLIAIITPAQQAYGRNDCSSYSRQTGRVTKFVITTSVDSGTCMVKDSSGRWIAKDNLREIVQP